MAKILDFTFAGYGLICDAILLKVMFHQVSYRYSRLRSLISSIRTRCRLRGMYNRVAAKLADLICLEENEKWYFRGR